MTQILLVDDDEDNLKLFTIVLENIGFDVSPYTDPVKALEEFKPNYYDLLILDYYMSQLDGLELYKKIKEIDKSALAILLTASHELLNANNEDLQEESCLEIVKKPVTVSGFIEVVDSVLSLEKQKVVV